MFNILNKVYVRTIDTWLASYTITIYRMQPQRAPVRIIMHVQYCMANQFSNKQVKDETPTPYLPLIPRLLS